MDQPSSEFSLSQPSHSAQSLLHLDLSSDLPSWRSGIGNGRFTVDGGGGAPALQQLPLLPSHSQSQPQPQSLSQSHAHLLKSIVNSSLQPASSTQPAQPPPQPQPQSHAQISSQAASSNQFITNPSYHLQQQHHPHHNQQPIQFTNLVTQLPLSDGPSSLPSHLGWSSQHNPLNFGSVPNSPVFGLGINNQLDLLSSQSIDHHNPFSHLNSAPFSGAHQSQSPYLSPSKPQDLPLLQPFGGQKSLLSFHQAEGYDSQLSSLSQGLPSYANPTGAAHTLAAVVAHHSATGSSYSPASATADSPGLAAAPSEPDSYSRLTSPLEPSALQLPLPPEPPGHWDHHPHSAPADSPGVHHTLPDEPSPEGAPYGSALGALNGGSKPYGERAKQSAWPLRDPNSTVLASPQSAGYSPFSPSPPYSPWSGLGGAEERPGALPPSSRAGQEAFARQLWTLYGPGDRGVPTGNELENLIRQLTELGLDVDQIRQHLNGPGWTRPLGADKESEGWPAQRTVAQKSVGAAAGEVPAGAGARDEKVTRQALRDQLQHHHPHHQVRLEKITENVEQACKLTQTSLKSPLFGREPSIERGRRSAIQAGRPACNLAGRWQESMNVDSGSPMVVEMDWRAHSRSRSRPPETTNMDWRQASRSRSRRQELRLDLPLGGVRLEGQQGGICGFEAAYGGGPTGEPASAPDYQQGLIEQLIGSYQAQQSEEDRLQALSAESERRSGGLFGPACSTAAGLGGPSMLTGTGSGASPLSEFDFGALDFPLRPSHHSLLGSIPGLTQDFAKLANAHAEYGSIPRLVRKTSFDEILAQQHQHQHHQKRGAGHANASEAGEEEPLSRVGTDARPNTATDECALGRMHVKASREGLQDVKAEKQDPDCALIPVTSPTFKRLGFFGPSSATPTLGSPRLTMMANSPERREEAGGDFLDGFAADEGAAFRRALECAGGLFGTGGIGGGAGAVEHVRSYEILRMNGFECAAGGGDGQTRWMTEGVAPGAVEMGLAGRVAGSGVGVSLNGRPGSRSSRSSSSGSSQDGAASKPSGPAAPVSQPPPPPQTMTVAQMKREEAKAGKFSGGRSSHVSSIGEARKRTKQLPYSSGEPVGTGVGVGIGNGVLSGVLSGGANGSGANCGPNGAGGGGVNGGGSGSGSGGGGHVTQCLNCQTKETPLWRRDSDGRPLCNACGLFANLHGIPRPAALSTGIIKRRNRGKNGEKNNQQQQQQQQGQQQQQQTVKVTGSMVNGAHGQGRMSSPTAVVGMSGPAGTGRTGTGGARTAAGAKETVKVHQNQRASGSGSGSGTSGSGGSGHGLGAGASAGGKGLGGASTGIGPDGCLLLAQHHPHQLCHQQDEQQPSPPQHQGVKKKK